MITFSTLEGYNEVVYNGQKTKGESKEVQPVIEVIGPKQVFALADRNLGGLK